MTHAVRVATVLSLLLASCATTFDPTDPSVAAAMHSNIVGWSDSPVGKVRLIKAQVDPWDGWSGGLYQAWRIETEDGTPLTQWLRYPRISNFGGYGATAVFLKSGKVLAFDTGEPLSNHDTSSRSAAWYACTPESTERMPYYHVMVLPQGGAVAFFAEWEGMDPAAANHERGPLTDSASVSGLLGWREQAHASMRRIRIVRLDDDGVPTGPPVAVDPRDKEGIGWRGDMLWALTPDKGYVLFDAQMQPVELPGAIDLRFGFDNVLVQLDEQGTLNWWASSSRQGAIAGPWLRHEVGRDHDMPRMLLSRADTTLRTLVHFRRGEPVVLFPDVVGIEFTTAELPEVLRGRGYFDQELEVALVRRNLAGQEVVEVCAINTFLGAEPMIAADRAGAESLLARHVTSQAEHYRQKDAAAAEALAAEDQRRLKVAMAQFGRAKEWATLYRNAMRDREYDVARRAIESIDLLLDVPAWPVNPELSQAISTRRKDLTVPSVDWAMHQPGASIESLLPHARTADFLGVGGPFWSRMRELMMSRKEPLARSTYDTLYHLGYHRMGEDGKEYLKWLSGEVDRAGAKAEYDGLMAAGNFSAANAIAYRLGEDGWIEHLLTSPEVSGREDLLRIAAQRRPTGDIHTRIEAKLDEAIASRLRIQRSELDSWARSADAERRGEQAANAQRSANFAEALRLARQGYEVRGF